MQIDQHIFSLEVAKTEAEQNRGLQYRKTLDAKNGMLFPFKESKIANFWMKDCYIDLDILFFNQGKLVSYVDSAKACHKDAKDCPIYGSGVPTDTVVELKTGTRKQLNIDFLAPLTPCHDKKLKKQSSQ